MEYRQEAIGLDFRIVYRIWQLTTQFHALMEYSAYFQHMIVSHPVKQQMAAMSAVFCDMKSSNSCPDLVTGLTAKQKRSLAA
jgi:hypothetical protein